MTTGNVLIIISLAVLIVHGFMFIYKTLQMVQKKKEALPEFLSPLQPTPEHQVVVIPRQPLDQPPHIPWINPMTGEPLPEQLEQLELPMLDLDHKRKFHFGGK